MGCELLAMGCAFGMWERDATRVRARMHFVMCRLYVQTVRFITLLRWSVRGPTAILRHEVSLTRHARAFVCAQASHRFV